MEEIYFMNPKYTYCNTSANEKKNRVIHHLHTRTLPPYPTQLLRWYTPNLLRKLPAPILSRLNRTRRRLKRLNLFADTGTFRVRR